MTTLRAMLSRLLASRWRHLVWLTPLGALVGLGFGFLFRDILYGVVIGCALGFLFGLMFVVRNPS
jgi:uncharacterized membrane protein